MLRNRPFVRFATNVAPVLAVLLHTSASGAEPVRTTRGGERAWAVRPAAATVPSATGARRGGWDRASSAELEGLAADVARKVFPHARGADLRFAGSDTFGDGDVVVRLDPHVTLPGVGALRILGRGASVRFDARGQVTFTLADLPPEARVRSFVASFDPASLLPVDRVLDAARPRSFLPVDADRVRLAVRAEADGLRAVYVVAPRPLEGVPTAPTWLVDATTGEVVFHREGVRFVNKALVYAANPASTPNLTNELLPILPTEATPKVLENDLVVTKSCIDKGRRASASLLGVSGTIHVCDLLHNAFPDAQGDWVDPPVDDGTSAAFEDPFSEVSMYYHVNRTYAFFRGLHGVADARVIAKKFLSVANLRLVAGLAEGDIGSATRADARLERFPNAFYSPGGDFFGYLHDASGPGLWFGQGYRRDYAYDGDVVAHEFTHAVVDETLKLGFYATDSFGAIDAPGAMNEGLADFFSSAAAGDPDVGEYAAKDASRVDSVIRTLANDDTCPKNLTGETHYDSTLFSGGLWSARTALPEADRSKFDAALYKAMRTNVGRDDLGYEELVGLFLATLRTDLPSGATSLEAEMTKRGVLPACARVLPWTGSPIQPPGGTGAIGVFAAPGKDGSGNVNRGDLYPGILQFSFDVPPGTEKITFGFSVRPSFGLGMSTSAPQPFAPTVIVKAGAPIVWTTGTKLAHDAPIVVEAGEGSATFDVPPGATKLYAQIANAGGEGSYTSVTWSAPPPKVDAGVKTVPATPADVTPTTTVVTTEGSCSCATVADSTTPASRFLALVSAAVLAAVSAIRRRSRKP
ncbi:MAG: hypothetical protein U0169_13340 [Polyangiaceae bacterium]